MELPLPSSEPRGAESHKLERLIERERLWNQSPGTSVQTAAILDRSGMNISFLPEEPLQQVQIKDAIRYRYGGITIDKDKLPAVSRTQEQRVFLFTTPGHLLRACGRHAFVVKA
jgi:hypothetical protein